MTDQNKIQFNYEIQNTNKKATKINTNYNIGTNSKLW